MKVSVNILTKNRAGFLKKALVSVAGQSFRDFEVVVVDDGSTDNTKQVLADFPPKADPPLAEKIITHASSAGITVSRQEELLASSGDYIAILDDDDEWADRDKLKKQAEYLDSNPDTILVGGGVIIEALGKADVMRLRPETDKQIRRAMLFRNNFFTSTVMFRRQAAILAGGFVSDGVDLAEDYDLWLRLGKLGKMHNFREIFARYRQAEYGQEKFKSFVKKQGNLIAKHHSDYPFYLPARALLSLRNIL